MRFLGLVVLLLLSTSCTNEQTDRRQAEKPSLLRPQANDLARFYEAEAIEVLHCITADSTQCSHPSLPGAVIINSYEDVIVPNEEFDAASMEELSNRFREYNEFVIIGSTVNVPPPFVDRVPSPRIIPDDLLPETEVRVTMHLLNGIAGERLVLLFHFGDRRLISFRRHPAQLISGEITQ